MAAFVQMRWGGLEPPRLAAHAPQLCVVSAALYNTLSRGFPRYGIDYGGRYVTPNYSYDFMESNILSTVSKSNW